MPVSRKRAERLAHRSVEAEVAHQPIVDGRVVLLADERRARSTAGTTTRHRARTAAVIVGPAGRRGLQAEIEVELAGATGRGER